MKILATILTTLALTTACKRATVDLTGHWHVWEYLDPVENPEMYKPADFDSSFTRQVDSCEAFNSPHEVLDIFSSSKIAWNNELMGYDGETGWLDMDKHIVEIGYESLHLLFKFDYRHDSLFLTGDNGEQYVATKRNCCDRQKEFFGTGSVVEVDLPIIADTTGMVNLSNVHQYLCPMACLGKVQARFNVCTPGVRLSLDGHFAAVDGIRPWLDNFKQTVAPNFRSQIRPIVFSTEATDFQQFFELLDSIYQGGQKDVYLAFRQRNYKDSLSVWLKPIDLYKDDYKSFIKENYRDYYEVTGAIPLETNN